MLTEFNNDTNFVVPKYFATKEATILQGSRDHVCLLNSSALWTFSIVRFTVDILLPSADRLPPDPLQSCQSAGRRACVMPTTVTFVIYIHIRSAQVFQKSRSLLIILGSRNVRRSQFLTEDQQTLDIALHNFVATATWQPGFVHLLCT